MTVSRVCVVLNGSSLCVEVEGDQEFVVAHSDNLLRRFASFDAEGNEHRAVESSETPGEDAALALGDYLQRKRVQTQVDRFLAIARWLELRGEKDLNTRGVNKAVDDDRQQKFTNASDSLNANEAKGYLYKTGDGFALTPKGRGRADAGFAKTT